MSTGVLLTFLQCDESGTGLMDEQRLIDAFCALDSDKNETKLKDPRTDVPTERKNVVKHLISLSNANTSQGVRYTTFLSWLFVPMLAGKDKNAIPIIKRISVCPFGVLGTHLTVSNGIAQNAPEPTADVAFVDPAGLHHVRHAGPGGAGGAAGVIYKWLGITEDPSFPEAVRLALNAPLMAKFHSYGDKKCIHGIGPDFRQRAYSREEAVFELAVCYNSLLREFSSSGLSILRLLPVSGGIFAGPFLPDLPSMTVLAIQWAFAMLGSKEQGNVLSAERLEMCIFMEKELADFQSAFASPE